MDVVVTEAAEGVTRGLLDEFADELTGRSRKRWVLLMVAFVGGAVFVLWFQRRRRSAGKAIFTDGPAEPAAA